MRLVRGNLQARTDRVYRAAAGSKTITRCRRARLIARGYFSITGRFAIYKRAPTIVGDVYGVIGFSSDSERVRVTANYHASWLERPAQLVEGSNPRSDLFSARFLNDNGNLVKKRTMPFFGSFKFKVN